jgi:hypothetical protein
MLNSSLLFDYSAQHSGVVLIPAEESVREIIQVCFEVAASANSITRGSKGRALVVDAECRIEKAPGMSRSLTET